MSFASQTDQLLLQTEYAGVGLKKRRIATKRISVTNICWKLTDALRLLYLTHNTINDRCHIHDKLPARSPTGRQQSYALFPAQPVLPLVPVVQSNRTNPNVSEGREYSQYVSLFKIKQGVECTVTNCLITNLFVQLVLGLQCTLQVLPTFADL